MVWNEIEDLAHAFRMQFRNERIVLFARADRRVELIMIGNVVTVHAFRTCLEKRRCVNVANSQRVEVGHNFSRLREGEPSVELQPIGANRNPWMLHFHGITANVERRTLNVQRRLQPLNSMFRVRCWTFEVFYILSGTLMPNKSSPRWSTRPARSHNARRELRAGSSDFQTGQA